MIALWIGLLAGGPVVAAQEAMTEAGDRTTDPRRSEDVTLGFKEADRAATFGLIGRLGSADPAVRDSAAAGLTEAGPGAFGALAEAYRQSDDYETRVRIQELVKDGFLWHRLLKHHAFLGIGFDMRIMNRSSPEESPRACALVAQVMNGSAADAAGIRVGDVIVTMDGAPFPADLGVEELRERIQSRGAGARLMLGLIREMGGGVETVEAVLAARPLAQYVDSELVEELNRKLQEFSTWWARHFALPADRGWRSRNPVPFKLPQ